MAENFWEEATLYTVDINNRVPPAKANRAGLCPSPSEKMHGEIPSLDDFVPFGCRGNALILVHGKAHKRRSEQVMYMRKEFGNVVGARFYHPPTNTFGTSGHLKWHPESLYDPNLTEYDVTAGLYGIGRLEDYQFLVVTTHYDAEDNLLHESLCGDVSGRISHSSQSGTDHEGRFNC